MQISLQLNGRTYSVDPQTYHDLSLPIDPVGGHPRFFCGDYASARPLQVGGFVGSMQAGGSVNAQSIQFVPHCHGTHSECVGHVISSAQPVLPQIRSGLMLAYLHSMPCVFADATEETYAHNDVLGSVPQEPLLTRTSLPSADILNQTEALLLRTVPNDESKKKRNYSEDPWYPVLTQQAIDYLASTSLQHLLLDTPSFDRADDGGRVYNHKAWWGVAADESVRWPRRGLTEMFYADNSIVDGWYLLDLQLAPIVSDAVPSRPLLYPLSREPLQNDT